MIISQSILQYYNPHLPTKITTDANKYGLGAVLEQMHGGKWKPIPFASKAKTPVEQNYIFIQSEALSIVFACKKYHQYIYGSHFIIENDHKPLKQISLKPLIKSPLRIQRFMQAYKHTTSN